MISIINQSKLLKERNEMENFTHPETTKTYVKPMNVIMNSMGAMILLKIQEQTLPSFSIISSKPTLTRFGTSAKKPST